MTHLCVSIFVTSVEQARRDIARAGEAGADMVELRVDVESDAAALSGLDIEALLQSAGLPCIVTCRPTWEGGYSALPEDDRLLVLQRAAEGGATYVDIELKELQRRGAHHGASGDAAAINSLLDLPRTTRVGVIASSHDFASRPARLLNVFEALNASVADVAKLAWTARTVRDNVEAFELLQNCRKPTIALCMGEAGLISRVLAKKFGAFLTFAALDAASGTAPGQVPIADMKRLYRWDKLGPRTKVYGVVGCPVAHSMSPAIHNAAFDAVGRDGVYVPLLVNPGYESFKAFMESFLAFAPLDLAGLSVTIPHKENALRYLLEAGADVEPLAERIGAVNTIAVARDADGRASLRGRNTDYAAILDTITAALGSTRAGLANFRVAVIGAGGIGRTAVAALAHCGATVVVYNRTTERADALAAEFDGTPGKVVAARMEKLCDSCCHVFVNATSVGMHPNVDASPTDGLGELTFTPDTLVFDTIYNPPVTKLLRAADMQGAKTVGGIEMFVRQAAAQFELWTDNPAPVGVMRGVVERRLGIAS